MLLDAGASINMVDKVGHNRCFFFRKYR